MEKLKKKEELDSIKDRFEELKTVLLPINTLHTYKRFMETKMMGPKPQQKVQVLHRGLRQV